jgi:DNA-binding IclR family transcriptional regulator
MSWSFLTNHGRVLLAIAADPRQTVRQISADVGITERAAHRVIANLAEAGYLERTRVGRRTEYGLNVHKLHVAPDERARVVRELVALLATHRPANPATDTGVGQPQQHPEQ